MAKRMRIVLVDDDTLVRRWLRMIVASQEDMEIAGEADDGSSGVAVAQQLRPDVMVVDIRMGSVDGIETTRRVLQRAPATRVLVLTTFDLDEYVYEALRAGASGFLLKSASADELLAAIRCVASGDALLSPSVTRKLIDAFAAVPTPASEPTLPCDVTEREREVLIAVAQGLTNTEISNRLCISLSTTKTHVSRLLTKLDVRSRAQLVIAAYESGLVIPGH